jgi:hypothetical protein
MVVVVDMLDCSVDTHHCSVDTAELFHAYFFYVSAGRFSLIFHITRVNYSGKANFKSRQFTPLHER